LDAYPESFEEFPEGFDHFVQLCFPSMHDIFSFFKVFNKSGT